MHKKLSKQSAVPLSYSHVISLQQLCIGQTQTTDGLPQYSGHVVIVPTLRNTSPSPNAAHLCAFNSFWTTIELSQRDKLQYIRIWLHGQYLVIGSINCWCWSFHWVCRQSQKYRLFTSNPRVAWASKVIFAWTKSRIAQKHWKGPYYYHITLDTHMWPVFSVTVHDLPWGQCSNKNPLLYRECKFNQSLLLLHFSYRYCVVDPIMKASQEVFWKTAGCMAALGWDVSH